MPELTSDTPGSYSQIPSTVERHTLDMHIRKSQVQLSETDEVARGLEFLQIMSKHSLSNALSFFVHNFKKSLSSSFYVPQHLFQFST